MLTGTLDGGILPWEIFTSDVLALPGQRTQWCVPVFPHACATELALRSPVHRAFHGKSRGSSRKPPTRLVIGVESRNSLTRHQLHAWLAGFGKSPEPEVVFKFLPIDLMLKAMEADAIDGFIAATPWGLVAEENQLGLLDRTFTPGKYAQQLVIACRRTEPLSGLAAMPGLAAAIGQARSLLTAPDAFRDAADQMAASGKPLLRAESLIAAARLHGLPADALDVVPDADRFTEELRRLESLSLLPPQIAAGEQTAKLLRIS